MKLLVLNGPNLNLLGEREPGIYGTGSMEDCLKTLKEAFSTDEIVYFQSNCEGALIDRLQQARREGIEGVALNAGAYTHTSIALHDCIRSLPFPVVEVHISNVHARESFRHVSMIAAACCGVVCGFGLDSYRLALEGLKLRAGGGQKA